MNVNIHEAKTHFSKLIKRVLRGEEVIIARAGRPVARLLPIAEKPKKRMPGTARGRIVVHPDFDAPLPNKIRKSFE